MLFPRRLQPQDSGEALLLSSSPHSLNHLLGPEDEASKASLDSRCMEGFKKRDGGWRGMI